MTGEKEIIMDITQINFQAHNLLREIYGPNAQFHQGQYEAIEHTLTYGRTLVVQKTGWGKSLVYFIATKLRRMENAGVTLVVSPLLILMENQLESAQKMGLKCAVLNSTTKDFHDSIIQEMQSGTIDLVFITPETLFGEKVQSIISDINIGLFVIDEAHCISGWGHDFRLSYTKLYRIIQNLPEHIPVIATTATANDRVVADLRNQLGQGKDIGISRGPLLRKNLSINILPLTNVEERYAWILKNINYLPGSGIIYCLTQHDCEYLSEYLCKNQINSMSYHSGQTDDYNTAVERAFYNNEIKVIVATVKLGMGYDKGDVGFVIHFQQPSNVVDYYQQIGRAGRNIQRAETFLMTGKEDARIQNFYINNAFPTQNECEEIQKKIRDNDGCTVSQLCNMLNFKKSRITKALMFMENYGSLEKEKSRYSVTFKPFFYDQDYYNSITEIRKQEQLAMADLCRTNRCYNQFIINQLDDNTTEVCGICGNCTGTMVDIYLEPERLTNVTEFLNSKKLSIQPRKIWMQYNHAYANGGIGVLNEIGICLSRYGSPGYGAMVSSDKYGAEGHFCKELQMAAANELIPLIAENNIQAITYIPSLRSDIVTKLAHDVANLCNIPCLQLLQKGQADPQKNMENSELQRNNALNSFCLMQGVPIPNRVILIDDIVDSRWTLTVCGDILTRNGVEKVYPFVLADSSSDKE